MAVASAALGTLGQAAGADENAPKPAAKKKPAVLKVGYVRHAQPSGGLEKYRHTYFNSQEIRFISHHQPKDKAKIVYASMSDIGEDGKSKTGGNSQTRWGVEDWRKGQWLHICVTVGDVGRRRGNRMYVQGELVSTWLWDSPPEVHAKAFTLGGQWDQRAPAKAMSIDDFRGYNRVLTSREIYELYRLGARRAEHLSRP